MRDWNLHTFSRQGTWGTSENLSFGTQQKITVQPLSQAGQSLILLRPCGQKELVWGIKQERFLWDELWAVRWEHAGPAGWMVSRKDNTKHWQTWHSLYEMLSCFMLSCSVSILAPCSVVSGKGYNFTLASVQIHSNSINERKKTPNTWL